MLICHCHRVRDEQVADLLDAGATKVGHVVRATGAGTDCGGCLPLLRDICAARATACATQHVDALAG